MGTTKRRMAQLTEKERQAIEAAILGGHKIEAIKLYREAVPGMGLKEAKDWVERLEPELRAQHPEPASAMPRKSGCLGLVAAIVTLLAGVAVVLIVIIHK
jgi:ribosomal protein L7/L12